MGEILGGRPKVKVDIQVTCSCSTMFISNIFWWIWCHESHSHLPWVESFLLQKLFILHFFIKSSALQMSSKKMVKDQGLSLDFSTWRRPEVSHLSLIITVVSLLTEAFGISTDSWCWTKSRNPDLLRGKKASDGFLMLFGTLLPQHLDKRARQIAY